MHKRIQYLKHLVTATNQHGVHSPFVYNYLIKCLYLKSKYQGSKTQKTVLKSIPYFAISQIKIKSEDLIIKNHIKKEFGLVPNNTPPFDLIYFDLSTHDVVLIEQENIHNDSMILIKDIHKNKTATAFWERLIKNEAVTVSLDLFYCGALFFRKEQAKEHFKIRI